MQRPDVAGLDFELDLAVRRQFRPDRCVIEILVPAQNALGFLGQLLRVDVARPEQQLLLDHVVPGHDVKPVRQSVETLVLARIGKVEHVLLDQCHPGDYPAFGSSFSIIGYGRNVLCARGNGRGRGQQEQARQRAGKSSRFCHRRIARSREPGR